MPEVGIDSINLSAKDVAGEAVVRGALFFGGFLIVGATFRFCTVGDGKIFFTTGLGFLLTFGFGTGEDSSQSKKMGPCLCGLQ